MKRKADNMRLLLGAVAAALLTACASIGRPEGGPRDMTPPVVVRTEPAERALNVSDNRVSIYFDENIQVEDPMTKVVVSPPQKTPPLVSGNGRRIRVEMRDTLVPNTTYTIDFADAIKDLNEGNILDGYALTFSTGPDIDTLAISGMVFESRNLEPAQGMIVGVYDASEWTDTTLTSLPLERITKTNQLGRFTIRGLHPGSYRIFAINDLNRDYHWDRSEDIAFYDMTVSPSIESVTVNDTLVGIDGSDSIVSRAGIRYLPDDILLTWFNENYSASYITKHERPERRKLSLQLSTPPDTMPELTVISGPHAGTPLSRLSVLEATAKRDSLTYWISDTTLSALDSLTIAARYLKTDSLDRLTMTTDTLQFNLRSEHKKKKEDKKKDKEEPDSITTGPTEFVSFALISSQMQDLNTGLTFESTTPIASIDSAGVRMEMLTDTVWTVVTPPRIVRIDSLNPRRFEASYKWNPSTKYRLSIDSAAVVDIYGLHNRPIVSELTTHATEDYAALYFNTTGLDGQPAIVELLRSDNPVRSVATVNGSATIDYVSPGPYYARLFIDRNGNGVWDTGSVADSIQPEEVFYYPKKLNLRKNWDIEQTWDIYQTPVDLQKPEDIKKNKPKKLKWQEQDKKNRKDEEEETDELWDTYSRDPFFQNNNLRH